MRLKLAVVVGELDVLVVKVEEHWRVWELKKVLAKRLRYSCSPMDITLYLAKDENGWLKFKNPDVAAIWNGNVRDSIRAVMNDANEMDPLSRIREFGFVESNTELHVLMKPPDGAKPLPYDYDKHLKELDAYEKEQVYRALSKGLLSARDWLTRTLGVSTASADAKKDV